MSSNYEEFKNKFKEFLRQNNVKEIDIIEGGSCGSGCCSYDSEIRFKFENGTNERYGEWELNPY